MVDFCLSKSIVGQEAGLFYMYRCVTVCPYDPLYECIVLILLLMCCNTFKIHESVNTLLHQSCLT